MPYEIRYEKTKKNLFEYCIACTLYWECARKFLCSQGIVIELLQETEIFYPFFCLTCYA